MTSPTYHPYPFDAAFSEAVILDGLIYLSVIWATMTMAIWRKGSMPKSIR
jgi:hypothetical protein